MRRIKLQKSVQTGFFVLVCILYLLPIFIVLMNSFKTNASINTSTFAFPNKDTFMGFSNFINGINVGEYPFLKSALYSLLITITSAALILVCTSMAAWYISRVNSLIARIVYYFCVFSMVVPGAVKGLTVTENLPFLLFPGFTTPDHVMLFEPVSYPLPLFNVVFDGIGFCTVNACLTGELFVTIKVYLITSPGATDDLSARTLRVFRA